MSDKHMPEAFRNLLRAFLFSVLVFPCPGEAEEASQISMAQQLSPGELVFVILTKHDEDETFASVLGMGKLDFREVNRLPAGIFAAIREHFDNGSLVDYRADRDADLDMADPAFYTLSVTDGGGPATVYRVPVNDQQTGMEIVELFIELVPDDYRSRLSREVEQ